VTHLLPWSPVLARFLRRSRDTDPQDCLQFALLIRDPLLRVLESHPVAIKETLICLAAAFARPESWFPLTPAVCGILRGAALIGHCGEVISVLGQCSPESLEHSASIWPILAGKLPDDWYKQLYEDLASQWLQPAPANILSLHGIVAGLVDRTISIYELMADDVADRCMKELETSNWSVQEWQTLAGYCRSALAALPLRHSGDEYTPAAFCDFLNGTVQIGVRRTDLDGQDSEPKRCSLKLCCPLAFLVAWTDQDPRDIRERLRDLPERPPAGFLNFVFDIDSLDENRLVMLYYLLAHDDDNVLTIQHRARCSPGSRDGHMGDSHHH
jgi:hypothetical protein